jgi:copper homeostasis protein
VEAGAAGIVIGASRPDTQLDGPLLERLVSIAREAAARRGRAVSVTLHRVFDLCTDPIAAVEAAIGLGFDRVLTSGGAETAFAGRETLAALVKQARGRIGILAASGIDPGNVGAILATGVDEIHASCQVPLPHPDPQLLRLGFVAESHGRATAGSVRALAAAIDSWRSHSS